MPLGVVARAVAGALNESVRHWWPIIPKEHPLPRTWPCPLSGEMAIIRAFAGWLV